MRGTSFHDVHTVDETDEDGEAWYISMGGGNVPTERSAGLFPMLVIRYCPSAPGRTAVDLHRTDQNCRTAINTAAISSMSDTMPLLPPHLLPFASLGGNVQRIRGIYTHPSRPQRFRLRPPCGY